MILKRIKENLSLFKDNLAFYINNESFSYGVLERKIIAIQKKLIENGLVENDIVVVENYNDIDTYASILAVWFSGGTFVPINPKHPKHRNELILNQLNIKFILSSSVNSFPIENATSLLTKNLKSINHELKIVETSIERILYILFTSGSTGIPKGVPISLKNITAFINNFGNAGYNLDEKDKFLQIYDLTFDASIPSYLFSLLIGASVYTVSLNKIKYLEALKIMQRNNITFAKISPSVLAYLQPYFDRIRLPHLRYCLLGGENFNLQVAKRWLPCVPNAQVQNVYGPTEATINTHIYNLTDKDLEKKTYQGIIAIGKPFGTNKAIVVDSLNNILQSNKKGELCLGGDQLTCGYFNDQKKNEESFFEKKIEAVKYRFYKTGDIVYIDNDGDYIFCGRADNQVKINGYRVELSEVENAAFKFGKALNYAVLSIKEKYGVIKIMLFCEKLEVGKGELFVFLKSHLPNYMIPSEIVALNEFPLTTSGKIDKIAIKSTYLKSIDLYE